MSDAIIENPVINSPYQEPRRHFKFGEDGITNEVIERRRVSSYFVPIARPRSYRPTHVQLQLPETEWTANRIQENEFINKVRARVAVWRQGGYVNITKTTKRLLEHWKTNDRERRLFFCQIEALETLIYLTEVAEKYGDAWIENDLRQARRRRRIRASFASPSRWRPAAARRSSWRCSSPGRRLTSWPTRRTARFSDAFLIVTPGITIRDRLRVLLPNDPENYYRTLRHRSRRACSRTWARPRSSSRTSTPSSCASGSRRAS